MTAPLYAILVFFSEVYGEYIIKKDVVQPNALVTVQRGDTVTLPCFYSNNFITYVSWFKQRLGQKPQIVAMSLNYQLSAIFFNEFGNITRFSAHRTGGIFNLTISQVEPSDSATYYCAITQYNDVTFGNGTTLMLTGPESQSRTVVLQQPESESVQPGDSVPDSVQCIVHTDTCAGEHSVYWFRQASGESPPGIIHTHGHRSDECQRSSGTVSPTQSCVYNFPKRNLSRSDAGTYYCAVATCGEILFGNGTKLHVEGKLI
ncbi:immunoglobulin kappa light chain-like [Conger conger]|uniref:immunoglobulin kappa light chain-like n=1 Tax=Conger conger TaxID=82655 RepID=UPI002A5AB3F5|nr:immunoglobulin kappa light chain-like [Conger conger]